MGQTQENKCHILCHRRKSSRAEESRTQVLWKDKWENPGSTLSEEEWRAKEKREAEDRETLRNFKKRQENIVLCSLKICV